MRGLQRLYLSAVRLECRNDRWLATLSTLADERVLSAAGMNSDMENQQSVVSTIAALKIFSPQEIEVLDLTGQEVRIHRSEEHTSELQSRGHLVCRLLLEK